MFRVIVNENSIVQLDKCQCECKKYRARKKRL